MAAPSSPSDALLYESRPIAYTDPAAFSATAALFGCVGPAIETARVIEFGCASAGNLIPMALRYPRASFLGIDISAEEIAVGRARVAALGLGNIKLEAIDIAQFSAPKGAFDYVIAHGVLSWVPAHVRAAMFRICAESLADDGLAAISFNVLPGWRQQQIIRDICQRNAGEGTEAERAARARAALTQIAQGSGEAHPYGALVTQAARRAANQPLSYIASEFIAEVNDLFFFEEVQRMAAGAGMHYVCEADLSQSLPEFFLPPSSLAAMRDMLDANPTRTQSLLDEVSGRTFRRAILSKRAPRGLDVGALAGLHFSTQLLAPAEAPGMLFTRARRSVEVADANVKAALLAMARAYPATMAGAELARGAGAGFWETMLRHLAADHVRVRRAPLAVGRADAPAPKAFALAQLEARENQPWVTTITHNFSRLSEDAQKLLPLLDGARQRAGLAAVLDGSPQRVNEALLQLEREALLAP